MNSKCFDILVIGGGILGASVAYDLSLNRRDLRIGLMEKESDLALHASGRNTGVIHRPFYINPEKKPIFAKCAQDSYFFWKKFAAKHNLPWREVGTLEIALDDKQFKHLEDYVLWAKRNGMTEDEIELLDSSGVGSIEPRVRCRGGLLCKTDVAVNFSDLTKKLAEEAQLRGAEIFLGSGVRGINFDGSFVSVDLGNGNSITTKYFINCAGGGSLGLAKMCGLGTSLSSFRIRGEYWKINDRFRNFTKRNIYSVPENTNFPFLDPHWIIRHDGSVEIGPNAVPVLGSDLFGGIKNKLKLFGNKEFIDLAVREWRSSLSKNIMAKRVKRFLPELDSSWLTEKGTAGLRSVIITSDGALAPEAIELRNDFSFHVLNYNSPGATGAPEFGKRIVEKIINLF